MHEHSIQTHEAVDPVCGMKVDKHDAEADQLTSEYEGTTYYFCSHECELAFDDDPERYLDPLYKPSM
jgi:YHS domain-containing protein